MNHQDVKHDDDGPAPIAQPREILGYAGSTAATVSALRRSQWTDDGTQFTLIVPVRPLWRMIVWQSTGIALCLVVFGLVLAVGLRPAGPSSADGLDVCLALSLLPLGLAAALAVRVVGLARSERSPGTVVISANGIDVTTSWSGRPKHYRIPLETISQVRLLAETPASTAAIPVRMLISTTHDQAMALTFDVHDRATYDALANAVRARLAASHSNGPWPVNPWVHIAV